MSYTPRHGRVLAAALTRLLGSPEHGALAFVRCLAHDIVEALASDPNFAIRDWDVKRVSRTEDQAIRTISADQAVEIRESKRTPTLLLVDTSQAGAGMDGIYSAAHEVREDRLFAEAMKHVFHEIQNGKLSRWHDYADRAVRLARRTSGGSLTPWMEYDFVCRVAEGDQTPGAHLHRIGLWPVCDQEGDDLTVTLESSRIFIECLLGATSSGKAPSARIEELQLSETPDPKRIELEKFLVHVDSLPIREALSILSLREDLWIGPLRREQGQEIAGIVLISWRAQSGKLYRWSGLLKGATEDSLPRFYVSGDPTQKSDFKTLEVRWKALPIGIKKGSVEYQISVRGGTGGHLASKTVSHSARQYEKCNFSEEDFDMPSDRAVVRAVATVKVVGNEDIPRLESEEFEVRVGPSPEPDRPETADIASTVRTFSEGLAEAANRGLVTKTTEAPRITAESSKGFFVLDAQIQPDRRKRFRVVRSALVARIDEVWCQHGGPIGRWIVEIRGSGERHTEPKFEPLGTNDSPEFDRVAVASRKFAERIRGSGSAAQIYDDKAQITHGIVQRYLRAWMKLLEIGDPELSLANTVEVRSRSGKTIGLIVLPTHPVRVAWHVGYDSLVLHTAFSQRKREGESLLRELECLDGALFPAFLPNPRGGAFVFADMIGFHATGMVPDTEKEPKAAVALLARAMGERDALESVPTVGGRSAAILGQEINKYLDCHEIGRMLRIHALRAGEGRTIARALGIVLRDISKRRSPEDDSEKDQRDDAIPSFELNLYPSKEQRGIAGRFIVDAREKRRSGTGPFSEEDQWMLRSIDLPGGIPMPRLRWSRMDAPEPTERTAHVAVAFDTFESKVVTDVTIADSTVPCQAFGLLTHYHRTFKSHPHPHWVGTIPHTAKGEKHPSHAEHTELLTKIQSALRGAVLRHLGGAETPLLRTDITPEKEKSLEKLHRLSDWVVTLDRNAGIEYFDAPNDRPTIYDSYVIDAVPEREDIGCLQLITTTANLYEVQDLLNDALDSMGLSQSRRNAIFLLNHLKALSGRLVIRLTGQKPAASELVALAISTANCRDAPKKDSCWFSLTDGFIIPADDVHDLLPPLSKSGSKGNSSGDDTGGERPDLLYVTATRDGLLFRFIEVKYRRNLSDARSPSLLDQIDRQTRRFRQRWERAYCDPGICTTFRALRRAKLARVLRFYADKAHRHGLPKERHKSLVAEIDRMVEKGPDYTFAKEVRGDRGWVFCPDFPEREPQEIFPGDWDARVFLFGPSLLPDSDMLLTMAPSTNTPSPDDQNGSSVEVTQDESGQTELTADGRDIPVMRPANIPEASSAHSKAGPDPFIVIGKDTRTDKEVGWTLGTKGNPHLLLAGLSGMGKTTCLVRMCEQMARAGICPVVFSFHQDIDEKLQKAVGPLRFVDFNGLGFNPLKVLNPQTQWGHLDVASDMCEIFAAIFPDLGDIQLQALRGSIKDSFGEVGWDSKDSSDTVPAFGRFVEILRSKPKPDRGLQTLLARLGELHDYGFFAEAPSQESLWEGVQPTVIRIHVTQNDNLQRAFASLVFYGLYKDMFRRGLQDRITHTLVFDEAHRAARLKLIPKMGKECRKYGISLVLASQEARDFDPSLFSAVANYLVLRCTEANAKILVRNVSDSRHERRLIDRIKQMDKYTAFYFGEGQPLPSHIHLSP